MFLEILEHFNYFKNKLILHHKQNLKPAELDGTGPARNPKTIINIIIFNGG